MEHLTSQLFHIIVNFLRNYGFGITVLVVLYRLKIFQVIYGITYMIISHTYLTYAYIVFGYRKLRHKLGNIK